MNKRRVIDSELAARTSQAAVKDAKFISMNSYKVEITKARLRSAILL